MAWYVWGNENEVAKGKGTYGRQFQSTHSFILLNTYLWSVYSMTGKGTERQIKPLLLWGVISSGRDR